MVRGHTGGQWRIWHWTPSLWYCCLYLQCGSCGQRPSNSQGASTWRTFGQSEEDPPFTNDNFYPVTGVFYLYETCIGFLIFPCNIKDYWFPAFLGSCEIENKYSTVCVCVYAHSVPQHVWIFATPLTIAHKAPLSRGIFQAGILVWIAISLSRGSSQPRDWTHISCIFCIGRQILYHCAMWEGPIPTMPISKYFKLT